jgi:hypothetical protein
MMMAVELMGDIWRKYNAVDGSTVCLYRKEGTPLVQIIHSLNGEENELVLMREDDVLQFLLLITRNGFEEVDPETGQLIEQQ